MDRAATLDWAAAVDRAVTDSFVIRADGDQGGRGGQRWTGYRLPSRLIQLVRVSRSRPGALRLSLRRLLHSRRPFQTLLRSKRLLAPITKKNTDLSDSQSPTVRRATDKGSRAVPPRAEGGWCVVVTSRRRVVEHMGSVSWKRRTAAVAAFALQAFHGRPAILLVSACQSECSVAPKTAALKPAASR